MLNRVSYKVIFACFLLLISTTFQVTAQCSVNAGNDTTVCQNAQFVRTAIITPAGASVRWYQFGNSSTILSNTATINITPRIADTIFYIAQLTTGSGPTACTASDTVRVIVLPSPRVNAGSDRTVCQNSQLNLSATILPSNATVNWYLLGSATSLSNTTSFVVPTSVSGTYNYVVKADSAATCSTLDTIRITINPKPDAGFNYTSNCGRKFSFTNTSTTAAGTLTDFCWNFGTGGNNCQSTALNPNYNFPRNSSGQNFSVQLIVTNSSGCRDTATQNVVVGASPYANLSSDQGITVINGQDYFFACTSGDTIFTFRNNSENYNSGTVYTINWGDGMSNTYNQTTFPAPLSSGSTVTHNYNTGIYTLTFTMTNGVCVDSAKYKVYVGNIPAGGVVGLAASTICAGNQQGIVISGTAGNTAGTIYTLSYNDGSSPLTLVAPIPDPDTLFHVFNTSSCGTSSTTGGTTYQNAFGAYLEIVSPCGSRAGSVVPIYVASKPRADFTVSPYDTICAGQTLTLTNTSDPGNNNVNGVCAPGKVIWQINPATPTTRYTLSSGNLGSIIGPNPNNWTAGSNTLNVRFDSTGVYTIRIIAANNTLCGMDTMIKTICVNPVPTASFNLSPDNGCTPLQVTANGTTNTPTCGQNSFQWTVTYASTAGCTPTNSDFAFVNGTNANSQNPQFNFVSPGVYTINLQTFAPNGRCSSAVVSKTVTVRAKPNVSLSGIPQDLCQNQTISPAATTSCYIDNSTLYAWTFSNGTPSASSQLSPGTVAFNSIGQQTIALTVTNVCGATTLQQNITVKPTPDVNTITNFVKCAGQPSGAINFSGSQSGTVFNWTNSNTTIGLAASGTGNIPTFTLTNSTNAAIIASITVTPELNGCPGSPVSFTITVNPNPTVSVNSLSICSGQSATLTATGADSYTWTPSTGLSSTTGNSVTANPSVTTAYTVTGLVTTTNCSSAATSTVTVKPVPAISGTKTDPNACATATGSITITGLTPGANYALSYSFNGSPRAPANITATASGTYTITGLAAGIYADITVTLNGCPSNALSFSLTDPNPPAAPVVTNNGPLCSGNTLNLTATTTATGTATWNWSGPGGFSSSDRTPSLTNATVAMSGTYQVTVTINSCTSAAGSTVVTVLQTPATPSVSSNSPVCSGNPLNLSASVSGNPSLSWGWTGPNSFSSTEQNPVVSNAATVSMSGTYRVIATANYTSPALNCPSSEATVVVTVNPTPVISGSTSTNPTDCASATGTITLSGLTANTPYQVHYTGPTGAVNPTLTSNASGNIIISGLRAGTYSDVYVELNGCPSNRVGPFSLTDPNPPAAPVITNNGPLCSGQTLNLTATTTATGTATWNWSGPNSFNSIEQNPAITAATVPMSGVYSVTVTINSCTSPAATTAVVVNPLAVAPAVTTPVVYCQRNTASALTATASPAHTLLWYPSSTGGTGTNTAPVPSTTTPGTYRFYVSQVTPENCEGPRSEIEVVVNPTPDVPDQNQTICSGADFSITPTGSAIPANTLYSWNLPMVTGGLTGAVAGSGQAIVTGTLFNPTDFAQTANYRVLPQSGNCPGDSFTIVISVNPAPRVNFSIADQVICSGTSSQPVTISSPTPGANIPWTATVPSGLIGVSASGTDLIPAQTITNNTSSSLNVVYTATAVTAGANGCPGAPANYTITVNPKPKIPDQSLSVCSGEPFSFAPTDNPPVSIVPAGIVYTWTVSSNNNLTGQQSQSVSQPRVSDTLVNLSNTPQQVVYTITPLTGNCTGNPFTLTVTVNPAPVIPPLFDTICSGTSFSLTPQNGIPASTVIVPAGTVYSWAVPAQPTGFSGAAAGNNAVDISGTLFNSNFAPGNIVYRVIPVSGVAGNCAGDTFDVTITVNPRASINNNPLSQELCTGGTTLPVSWSSFTAGASYAWTLVHTGVISGFMPAGAGPELAAMQLTNNSDARDSVVYAVSSTANACAGAPTNYIIYVNPDAKARINYPADTACWPFNIQIQNTSPSTANGGYKWYANHQLIGQSTAFPGYTIPGPSDSVLIKLYAESLYGCLNDSISHVFRTQPKPQPSFVFEPRDSCGPLQARFRNTTPLLDTFRYAWNFGDGQISNAANPGLISFLPSPYFSDTTYYISLRAFNECDTVTFVDSIVVRSKPKARFGISSTNGCSPFRVTLSNTSIANENSIYYWDFGNGNRDTVYDRRSVEYTYFVANEPDTFDLKLIVVNPCGADSQITRVRVAPNTIRPLININAQDLFGCIPHTVQFQNSSLGATEYNWDFGDGSSLITRDTLNPVFHTYLTDGQFTVTVSMTNGCSDTTQQLQVTVFPRIQPAFTVNPVFCDGDTVRVRNTTPGANQYRWYWGDGQMSTGQEPFHVYAQAGTYTILLYAERSNSNGLVCIDSTSRTINIQTGPDMLLQTNIASVNCAPFTLNAILPAIISESIQWQVYDTAISPQPAVFNGPQLQYTFVKPGTFVILAYGVTAAGCKDSVRLSVTVRGTPDASFTPGNISVCKRDTTISYFNTSTYNDFGPLTYRWFVNGNLAGTLGNFTYRYLTAPNVPLPVQFETRLVATNSVGCSDTATAILQMNPDPRAAFVLTNLDQCVPFVPAVNNASVNADRYEWFLNAVLVDTARVPRFTIRNAATAYTVRLIVYNRFDCRPDTASFSFVSRSKPIAAFRLNDTLGCTGYLNVITTNTSQFASFYRWDWGDATLGSSFTSPTHAYNRNGRYLITLVASDGICTDTTSRYVVVSEKPVVDFDADVKTSCDSARVQFSNLTRNAVNYTWYFGDGQRSDAINPYHVFAPSNGLYAVSLLAINADGCRDSLTKAGLIRAIVIPDAGFVINPGSVISIPNYSFSFLNTTLDNPMYKYLWNLGDGTTGSTRDITHKYADTGTYPVKLIVVDFNTGCPDTVIKTVRIEGQPGYLYVPNAFYPNSLQNQFRWFRPLGKGLKDYRLQVFDAWGKLLFETTELDAAGSPVVGWDGTYKGQPMPQDAYAWRITAVFRNGRKWEGMSYTQNEKGLPGHTFGTVTLFR